GPAQPSGTPGGAVVATPLPDLGPPNVVIVLADDLGWGDLGSYGNKVIRTPNIDRLAAEGARYTTFYVPTPICAASRAGLLTGRFPGRVGIPWNPPRRLNRGEVVLASVLRERGYATGMVGKWHLGWDREEMPIHYGFDFYYGLPAGEDETDFILGDLPTKDSVPPDQLARRYTETAIKFMASQPRDRRFFTYLAHRDPHLDNFPAPEFAGRSAAGAYGDVIEQLDAWVGELMKWLRDSGLDQNTLVIFMSDNGPMIPPRGPGSAGPWSGGKFSCEEGGVRVPAIMRWPARIRPGRVVNEIVSSLDLFPTLVTLTGATLPARHYDGQDVSKLVTGEVDRVGGPGMDGGREVVFSGQDGAAGIRSGKWKYLRPGIWSGTTTLFDLEADPGEQQDLSRARPELVKQLEARLQELIR
ncbi:MAG TPA: sulfatase-like hydrolase/transferase, partial [Vicinamibacteria bacterium]|nr:sulfatase-like hydrolase/transferase [Vicinamibacteria bacterium]